MTTKLSLQLARHYTNNHDDCSFIGHALAAALSQTSLLWLLQTTVTLLEDLCSIKLCFMNFVFFFLDKTSISDQCLFRFVGEEQNQES